MGFACCSTELYILFFLKILIFRNAAMGFTYLRLDELFIFIKISLMYNIVFDTHILQHD